jgi:recombination protein RecR
MRVAKPIQDVVDSFQKLPGIGPKSAERLTYYLLRVPQSQLDDFAESVGNLKKLTVLCSLCKNVSEADPCSICTDTKRDQNTILVLEEALDILVFEKTGYKGLYHILHGVINPLDNIGPDELYIEALLKRIENTQDEPIEEVIIATNPTMEGEATAMYLDKQIKQKFEKIKVTRLGMGIPTGADLGFADAQTLNSALSGRRTL